MVNASHVVLDNNPITQSCIYISGDTSLYAKNLTGDWICRLAYYNKSNPELVRQYVVAPSLFFKVTCALLKRKEPLLIQGRQMSLFKLSEADSIVLLVSGDERPTKELLEEFAMTAWLLYG